MIKKKNYKKLKLDRTVEKKELDKLWAELVKLRASNKCEKCGKREYLNAHHIYSRSNYSTRWDETNGCCLCAGHHTLTNDSAHKAPMEFIEWIKEKRGETWYQTLRLKANNIHKQDKKLLKIYLEEEIKKWKLINLK